MRIVQLRMATLIIAASTSPGRAAESEQKMKYFLMIAEPKGSAWAGVIRAGGVPRIRETQLYVAAIMGRLSDHSRE